MVKGKCPPPGVVRSGAEEEGVRGREEEGDSESLLRWERWRRWLSDGSSSRNDTCTEQGDGCQCSSMFET